MASRFNFRAWDGERMWRPKELEQFGDAGICCVDGQSISENKHTGKDPVIGKHHAALMQSTGRTDKNGVEIFEGDILSGYDIPTGKDYTFAISWNGAHLNTAYIRSDNRIIGNIHQSPELLLDKV